MKFATIFPNFESVHLTKDVGMIPAAFSSSTEAKSYVIYWDRTGIKIEHQFGINYELVPLVARTKILFYFYALIFILKNNVGLINLFHLKRETYIFSLLMRVFKKKIYLKMDMDSTRFPHFVELLNSSGNIKSSLLRFLLRTPSLISTENKKFYDILTGFKIFKNKLMYFPNSIYTPTVSVNPVSWTLREKRILVVGRLGDYQKNTEMLLYSLEDIDSMKGWKISLIGNATDDFLIRLGEFYRNKPTLKNNVEYLGSLERKELFEYYSKSRILLFTSRWEGMSLAMVEASFMGVALLTTNVDAVDEITCGGTLGKIYTSENMKELTQSLNTIFNTSTFFDDKYNERIKFVRDHFTLDKNIIDLVERLK
ncbi:hypothetical protein BCU24_21120 [Vibrio cyclitrophicus]|uniref:glycosyltransferase family 4 protein n=1 Tax=Vibrio cyclitrophicus TaxID=47951 RepID=UPI000C859A99|nr:glycosyltransferase family 4 protein [Vibrio cyclitrophicus]PMJ21406.1 hypothetical protein BCU28_10460 [Vibrio cyclitrophicus]PMJ38248.1 hypothetical protein BCU24_21120 [Vibrio cyclitrophicus]